MIVYNETIIVEEHIHKEWLRWMKQVHIPGIMTTGFFDSHRILKVIDSPNEGVTYCIQYSAADAGRFEQFYMNHLPQFHALHQQRYAERFVMFNTIMEEVE